MALTWPATCRFQIRKQRWYRRVALAQSLFELGRCLLGKGHAEVRGHTFHRVGQPLGQCPIVLLECIRDLGACVCLFSYELLEQAAVELLVAGDPFQTALNVYSFDWRNLYVHPRRGFLFGRGSRRLTPLRPLRQSGEERIGIDGLCHMAVHASLETALPFLHEGMRSHRQDREIVESRVGAEMTGRREAVHFGHLQVHQHDVKWRRLRSVPKQIHGDLAVPRNRDDGSRTLQQLGGDLLV